MSCYNWESGSIKFSVKEWATFKRKFREGFNQLQETELAVATRHWDKYKSGKLPKEYHGNFEEEKQRFYMLWQKWTPKPTDNFPKNGSWDKRNRPRKPIRKDFPLANNKQTDFQIDEGGIKLDSKTREAHYHSGDNNRQVERAREHKVGQMFFRLLSQVTWTRGTGGKLIGNDEYNQDQDGEGGGGNYVTETYSQEEQKKERMSRSHSYGSYGYRL